MSERSLAALAKPADQRQTLTAGRKHFMDDTVRAEHHQAAALRQYVQRALLAQMQAQLAAMLGQPAVVEVKHGGYRPAIVIAETIQVPLVEGTQRIEGEMTFEIFQAEKQLPIQGLTQRIDELQVLIATLRLPRLDPLDMVATDAFAYLEQLAAAYRGRRQQTLLFANTALCGQFPGQSVWQEDALLRPAMFGQVIGDSQQQRVMGLNEHARFYSRPGMPRQEIPRRRKYRPSQEFQMRFISMVSLLLFSLAAYADEHDRLWQAAGWAEQRAHFSQALSAAQQRYSGTLPPAVYQALVNNSNQRFAPQAMDQRVRAGLRQNLAEAHPALAFFASALGRKIVAAEVAATSREELARNANGLPQNEASATRRLLIRHLAQALPAREAGAEVSLALAGVAADSLSQMIPGLLGGEQAQALLNNQRARLMEQIGADLDNTLLYVYRDLSDPELEEFVGFAESTQGRAYYQAALAALRAGLAVGQSGSSAPTQAGS